MSRKERGFIAIILMSIVIMVAIDLATDSREGVVWWHLLSEAMIAFIALLGIFMLVRNSIKLKHSLEDEKKNSETLKALAEKWRMHSKKYLEGLSQAIDLQLTNWNLTSSEKEVAFLLLKGLSLKEIAVARNTAVKTARAQSMVVYSKSGLSGRSELAAFFLEDLLVPQKSENAELEQLTVSK
ncbi:MAG: hypothetical protein ABL927_01965 [Bdellovibrionales bacterium]